MAKRSIINRFNLIPIFILAMVFFSGTAYGFPEVYDLEDYDEFIQDGYNILHLDYLAIWDNLVTKDNPDHPFGQIWLILYDPDPYTDMDEMEENKWNRSRELARFQIPGPRSHDRWAGEDELVFWSAGLYDWGSDDFDRIVFRIMVENPSPENDTDTVMWGTIEEDDSYTSLEFSDDYASVKFRTCDLPEYESPPYITFNEIWFEHEVEEDGVEGLYVHLDFQVDYMRGQIGRLAAYVHYDEDGNSVECGIDDPDYMTSDGNLTNQFDFMPYYPYTIYSDFTLFLPYEAFPRSDDYVAYYLNIEMLDEDWNFIGSSESPVFEVLVPK